jgi:hypothetical protein
MARFATDLVRPLGLAENQFLEVLVSRFTIRRKGQGAELEIQFDENTPAIWTRHAKYEVQKTIPDFEKKASDYQQALDRFLIEGKGSIFEFNDPAFPFRYASGGALPVLRFKGGDYYCLFYRDIFPIGWNIANGGCDNRDELCNPTDTIERELREELIIVDLKNEKRYVFEGDAGKPLDRPEFAIARRFWKERFKQLNYPEFEELVIPLKWLEGPDTIKIRIGGESPKIVAGCFLNINAEDFGIEVDRIARINLDQDVVLCFGEIIGNKLVNTIVGLFQVEKFNRDVLPGKTEFFPDFFFFNAKRYASSKFQEVLYGEFIKHIRKLRSEEENNRFDSAKQKYNLCPVTRRIIKRYLSLRSEKPEKAAGPYDVFISSSGEDVKLAAKVYKFLDQKGIKAFFYKETARDPNVLRMIDEALESAKCLVAVGSKRENLLKPFVEFEWRSFFHDILLERKKDAKLLAFIGGFDPYDLPRELRYNQWIKFQKPNVNHALGELYKNLCR